MILKLLEYLSLEPNSWFIMFESVSTRMILAALSAWLIVMLFGPFFIKTLYQLKIGQVIRKEHVPVLKELHAKKENTPTMGGGIILLALLLSGAFWMKLNHIFTVILFVSVSYFGAIGALDDYLKIKGRSSSGLKGRLKFLLQSLFAVVLSCMLLNEQFIQWIESCTSLTMPLAKFHLEEGKSLLLTLSDYSQSLEIPFLKKTLFFSGWWWQCLFIFAFVFIITGSSNAVNLTDGLDGLATGCVLLAAAALSVVALVSNHVQWAQNLQIFYIEGSGEIAVFLAALIGSCLGFLWYNTSPAQVFMGDTGSLSLGGILGVCAILLKKELFFGLVSGVFVLETLSVIFQVSYFKWTKGKRLFKCAPLHHHFEYKGWPENKIVVRFWIIGLLFTLVALASIRV
jgi:phospho-N-acetylmuramoyl-pentapeptide-transferase